MSSSRVPVVAFLGGFGRGNIGNEASLQVAIDLLQEEVPGAEVQIVTLFPKEAAVKYRYPILPLRPGVLAASRVQYRPLKYLVAGAGELTLWTQTIRRLRSVSAVVVPGTGILDDFGEPPWGLPLSVLAWATLARLARRPFFFISIGAGPIRGRIALRQLVMAARVATYVSYRDEASRDFMRNAGVETGDQTVTCDIVFGRAYEPARSNRHERPLTVGVGVMAYGGWAGATTGPIYDRYVALLGEVVSRLLDLGHKVRFLIGQPVDRGTVDDILALAGIAEHPNLAIPGMEDFDALLREVELTDFVIATRYHNVVAALLARRPVISLSYAPKNGELMQRLGLSDLDCPVEVSDSNWVMERVARVCEEGFQFSAEVEDVLTGWREVTRNEIRRVIETCPR